MITWNRGNDTGFHDHDVSRGAVAVVEGEVVEERLVMGGPPLRRHHAAGSTFDFDASHVHRMCLDAGGPAVSIHAYSPPLWRMGAYTVAPDGTLQRVSVSYAEELRRGGLRRSLRTRRGRRSRQRRRQASGAAVPRERARGCRPVGRAA